MTALFPLNLVLALCWVVMTGSYTILNFTFGYCISFAALSLLRSQLPFHRYIRHIGSVLSLACTFLKELISSTWSVVKTAWNPRPEYRTGFVAIPLNLKSDLEITLLANLVTLTPGTLSVDISDDRSTLYIHALQADDIETIRTNIRESFEQKISRVMQ